jgi:hypothetical protein
MDDNLDYDPKSENDCNQMSEEEQLQEHICQQQTGLAITSLVLGICSIAACMGPLTGIPAVICGDDSAHVPDFA